MTKQIGPALTAQLNNLGIKTCSQLIKYPRQALVSRFGKVGSWLAECLQPNYEALEHTKIPEIPKSIGHSYTLPKETSNTKIIEGWIRLLAEMVAYRLRKSGLEAYTICLWLNNSQTRGFSRQKIFQTSTYSGYGYIPAR